MVYFGKVLKMHSRMKNYSCVKRGKRKGEVPDSIDLVPTQGETKAGAGSVRLGPTINRREGTTCAETVFIRA